MDLIFFFDQYVRNNLLKPGLLSYMDTQDGNGNTPLAAAFESIYARYPPPATSGVFSLVSEEVTGTITYGNVGDLDPVSFSFTYLDAVWDENDTLFDSFNTVWSGSIPTEIEILLLNDDSLPGGTAEGIAFDAATVMTSNGASSSDYMFTPVHPPALVPALGAFGSALMVCLMGLAGYRKLR